MSMDMVWKTFTIPQILANHEMIIRRRINNEIFWINLHCTKPIQKPSWLTTPPSFLKWNKSSIIEKDIENDENYMITYYEKRKKELDFWNRMNQKVGEINNIGG